MSGPAFRVVLEESMQDHPIKAVIYSGLLALIDVGVNIVLSGLLEAVFPKYDPGKNVWLGGLEAVAEIALHVVFSNVFLLVGGELFSTEGTLVPFGALVGIFLLGNALEKLCERLGVKRETAHRALGDAIMTANVLTLMARWYSRHKGINTLAELAALSQDIVRTTGRGHR
jgi:hypothetical protein